MTIPLIRGLRELSSAYDGFILDIWGVVHQGGDAYPEAVECIRQLRAEGKRVVFLSNAPRRAEKVAQILADKGIPRDLYDGVLSSGEAARIAFETENEAPLNALGRRYFLLAADGDDDLLHGLDYSPASNIAEADFLLTIGLSAHRPSIAAHEETLGQAAARGVTMVCVNPDVEVVRLGQRELCAGALAQYYEEIGGTVAHVGKPYPFVYRLCLDMLDVAQQKRVLAVGDGLETDIPGARAAGIDALLVTGGLLAESLGVTRFEAPDGQALAELCRAANECPRAAIPALNW
jgi:HAD superfamily hydrolase (TIGR01459 family)